MSLERTRNCRRKPARGYLEIVTFYRLEMFQSGQGLTYPVLRGVKQTRPSSFNFKWLYPQSYWPIFNAPFMGDFSLPRLMTPEGKPGFRCINEIIQHLGDAKRHPLLLTNSSKSNNMYFLLLMYTYNYKLYIYIFIFLLAYPVTFSFRSVSYTYFCSNI